MFMTHRREGHHCIESRSVQPCYAERDRSSGGSERPRAESADVDLGRMLRLVTCHLGYDSAAYYCAVSSASSGGEG
ncbi:hypothetical protein MRX96_012190 [Rhipicephalus microplus]